MASMMDCRIAFRLSIIVAGMMLADDRRPSHADKRRAITKEMLTKQFLSSLPNTADMKKFRKLITDVISLCA